MSIIKEATDKGFYDYFLNNLKYRLENVDGKWCQKINDISGRDFYETRPIEYMSFQEIEDLKFEVIEDVGNEVDDNDFYDMFYDMYGNETSIEDELYKAGYAWSDEADFYEALRQYMEEKLFQKAFDSLLNN
jgi:hypothetical protein